MTPPPDVVSEGEGLHHADAGPGPVGPPPRGGPEDRVQQPVHRAVPHHPQEAPARGLAQRLQNFPQHVCGIKSDYIHKKIIARE